jgi:hypothetical protein
MSGSLLSNVLSLASGECRWIGRHDIHVYCMAGCGREAQYCVVCPDAGFEYGAWVSADEACRLIAQALNTKGAA